MSSSLQTCYWSRDEPAHLDYVPCFDHDGIGPCCRRGDVCLFSNGCYTSDTNITYIAGCTDPTYEDGACPAGECNRDSNFQALARCPQGWGCCEGYGQSGLFPSVAEDDRDECSCDQDLLIAISDRGRLGRITSLPSDRTRGSTTTTPSTSSSPTSSSDDTSTSSDSTLRTQSSASNTSGSSNTVVGEAGSTSTNTLTTSTPEQQPALSRGGRIGVGVGVSIGVLIIAAIVAILFYKRRQRQKGGSNVDRSTAIAQGSVLYQSEKTPLSYVQPPPGASSFHDSDTPGEPFPTQSRPSPSTGSSWNSPPSNKPTESPHLSQISELQAHEPNFSGNGAEQNSNQSGYFR